METYLKNTTGKLCFKHAVKKVIEGKGQDIEIEVFDNTDCGASGCWWIGSCYECNKKESKKQKE